MGQLESLQPNSRNLKEEVLSSFLCVHRARRTRKETLLDGTNAAAGRMSREGARAGASGMVRVRVWIVRHGQREDEVEGNDWGRTGASKDVWFDPPLTQAGGQHAQQVARRFQRYMHQRQGSSSSPFHVIYSSPLLRALQTASAFAQVTSTLLLLRLLLLLLLSSPLPIT